MVKNIAESVGDTFEYDSNSPGGYTFQQHSTNSSTLNKIALGDWDFVVLQEQSQLPSFPLPQVEQMVFPYAASLNQEIKSKNSCAETVFYMTWGRENGDSQNCTGWPPVCTYEGMDDLLQERYGMMADQNQALLAPIAVVWREIRTTYPDIELYISDGSHPSVAGTYAAACTFYSVFYRKDPELIAFNAGLDSEQAEQIRTVVKEKVFFHLSDWHIGEYDAQSDFEFEHLGNGAVQFHNLSVYANEFWWDFGDGNHSTEENPLHTYAQAGNYTVQLKALHCDTENLTEYELELDFMNTVDFDSRSIQFYPNPATTLLYIESNLDLAGMNYLIYSAEGQLKEKGKLNHNQLNIKHLEKGVYLLQIEDLNQKMKFIKK